MKDIFGPVVDIMGKALSLRAKRNAAISSNIANIDTPGYKAKDINFEQVMESYLKDKGLKKEGEGQADIPLRTTNGRHITSRPRLVRPSLEQSTEKGVPNNVDLDEEMARLSKNNIEYQLTTQMLIKKFEILKTAITEGGKP